MDSPNVLDMLPAECESGCGCTGQDSAEDTSPLHSHTFYELFYVLSGRAIHNINGQNHIVSEGTLAFIRPHDMHTYFPIENYGFSIVSTGFQPKELDSLRLWLEMDLRALLDSPMPTYIQLHGAERHFLEKCLRAIRQRDYGLPRRQLFHAFFPMFLHLLSVPQADAQHAFIPPWLSQIIEQMGKRDNYIIGLERLYELTEYSVEYTTRCFQTYLHTTPTELINSNRINYAAHLLKENKAQSITDICYAVGFNNLSYFYQVFHRVFGCTPRQYSKQ